MDMHPNTIPDIAAAARGKLAPHVYDYLSGGAGSEAALRRNRVLVGHLRMGPVLRVRGGGEGDRSGGDGRGKQADGGHADIPCLSRASREYPRVATR